MGGCSAAIKRPWYRRVAVPATVREANPPKPLATNHSRTSAASSSPHTSLPNCTSARRRAAGVVGSIKTLPPSGHKLSSQRGRKSSLPALLQCLNYSAKNGVWMVCRSLFQPRPVYSYITDGQGGTLFQIGIQVSCSGTEAPETRTTVFGVGSSPTYPTPPPNIACPMSKICLWREFFRFSCAEEAS